MIQRGSTACSCFPFFSVAITCKIGSFLSSLDNLLQENVIVFFSFRFFFFFKSNFKMALIWKKKAILYLLFTFFNHQRKVTKFPSAHISLTYIHVFLLTLLTFLPYQFWKKKKNTNLSGMVSLWCDSWCWFLSTPSWNNQQITKWWAKLKLECLLLTYAKFIVICKPRTLNDGRWRLRSIQKTQKALLLSSSHSAFYR